MSDPFDLFVIGAGSGGVRAARVAAELGARVAICESSRLGGTCVNVGCVPKKLMVYGSHFASEAAWARGYGWTLAAPRHEWSAFLAAKDREIARLNGVYGRLLEAAGVTTLEGHGRLTGPRSVAVGDREYACRSVLIATGGAPWIPDDLHGREHVLVSDDVFALPALPRRVLFIGGGYIGTELACVLHGFGAEVTLVHRSDHVLGGFDEDVRRVLTENLAHLGLDLRLRRCVHAVERTAEGALDVLLDDGGRITVDAVVAATGRRPRVADLGLAEVGVEVDEYGAILVDHEQRTSAPSVFAVGDVTGRMELTPVALEEGMRLAQRLFGAGPPPPPIDYELVPTAIFTQPSVGTVGLSEARARERFPETRVFRSEFRNLRHTLSGSPERTLVKVVVDGATDRVLGIHMVGPEAGEVIQGFAVAMTCGLTKAQLDATIGIHPTVAEELVTLRRAVDG